MWQKQFWNIFDVSFIFIAKSNTYFMCLLEIELLEEILKLILKINILMLLCGSSGNSEYFVAVVPAKPLNHSKESV